MGEGKNVVVEFSKYLTVTVGVKCFLSTFDKSRNRGTYILFYATMINTRKTKQTLATVVVSRR